MRRQWNGTNRTDRYNPNSLFHWELHSFCIMNNSWFWFLIDDDQNQTNETSQYIVHPIFALSIVLRKVKSHEIILGKTLHSIVANLILNSNFITDSI